MKYVGFITLLKKLVNSAKLIYNDETLMNEEYGIRDLRDKFDFQNDTAITEYSCKSIHLNQICNFVD